MFISEKLLNMYNWIITTTNVLLILIRNKNLFSYGFFCFLFFSMANIFLIAVIYFILLKIRKICEQNIRNLKNIGHIVLRAVQFLALVLFFMIIILMRITWYCYHRCYIIVRTHEHTPGLSLRLILRLSVFSLKFLRKE